MTLGFVHLNVLPKHERRIQIRAVNLNHEKNVSDFTRSLIFQEPYGPKLILMVALQSSCIGNTAGYGYTPTSIFNSATIVNIYKKTFWGDFIKYL